MPVSDVYLDQLATYLEQCIDDPDLFNDLFLDRPEYFAKQKDICRSLVSYRSTVVYSGNMVGKDYVVGGIPHWWLHTRPDSLVIVTGPSQTTLGTVTWKEIRRASKSAPIPLGSRITQGAKSSPLQIEVDNDGWQALGYSTTSVERALGQHDENLLVIVEEASAVEDEIWDAIESLGYERLLAIGNPIRCDGRFVSLIRQAERDAADRTLPRLAVNAIRIKSTESPHADLEKSPVGLADKTWLTATERRYGRNSLWFKSHVEAEIPSVSADILLPIAWLDFAFTQKRPILPPNHPVHATRRLSCDLGEGVGRDSSCVLVRDDWGVLECHFGSQLGLPEAANLMASLGRKWGIPAERMTFDKLGIGKNFPNHLAKHGLQHARPYAGEASPRDSVFTNLRTECAWLLRQRLDPMHAPDIRTPFAAQASFTFAAGLYQSRLRIELEPLTYSLVGKHTKLLPKDEHALILGHSPDVSDALIQSFSF